MMEDGRPRPSIPVDGDQLMNKTARMVAMALAIISSNSSGAVETPSVSGVVVDSAGVEVAHALIEAMPRPSDGGSGIVGDRPNPWIQADGHGRFGLTLPAGRYKIRAKDEAGGYPDPVYLLNTDQTANFPEISVGQADISDVRVVLGKRGGVLSGKLLDHSSRAPIFKGKITISDARNPDAYVEVFADAQGNFQFAVPAKPIIVSATAAGYKTSGGTELTLSGGERRVISLELQHQ